MEQRDQKQKGPLIAQRPYALIRMIFAFDPSLKNAQDKLDTICQNPPSLSSKALRVKINRSV